MLVSIKFPDVIHIAYYLGIATVDGWTVVKRCYYARASISVPLDRVSNLVVVEVEKGYAART